MSATRELADLLVGPNRPEPPLLRQGVVSAVGAGIVSVQLAGSPYAVGNVRYLDSYEPVVGDVVWMLKNGPDLLVLGALQIGALPAPPAPPAEAVIGTSQSTSSASLTDLATVGPEVTDLYCVGGALVSFQAWATQNAQGRQALMSAYVYESVSGANVYGGSNARSAVGQEVSAGSAFSVQGSFLFIAPAPGLYDFVAKYRISTAGGVADFSNRRLIAWPF